MLFLSISLSPIKEHFIFFESTIELKGGDDDDEDEEE